MNYYAYIMHTCNIDTNLISFFSLVAHLAGSNTLAPNLTNVGSLLGQSLNVNDLATLNTNAPFGSATINAGQLNAGLNAGLAGLNAGIAPGLTVGGGLSIQY